MSKVDLVFDEQNKSKRIRKPLSKNKLKQIESWMLVEKVKREPVQTVLERLCISATKLQTVIRAFERAGVQYDSYRSGFYGVYQRQKDAEKLAQR
ncbi:hypothetical protein [Pseudoalteromonas sp. Of7M-16]|uniref:hypothetical protein n=1 Tax=Pseudoalteromonas sp. Of7M-16 TaxID=2917756 RepID=UPI001EF6A834|nr:hypothetical protein [Pseudoalteromonas sp. Of7M-16]MCG7550909.1 hypothetical protein [Pseudoalteromonas sp. Of7M-16]